jgi:hypothetical protein
MCIYYEWVVLVVLSCSYKKVQNFISFVLDPKLLRTSPAASSDASVWAATYPRNAGMSGSTRWWSAAATLRSSFSCRRRAAPPRPRARHPTRRPAPAAPRPTRRAGCRPLPPSSSPPPAVPVPLIFSAQSHEERRSACCSAAAWHRKALNPSSRPALTPAAPSCSSSSFPSASPRRGSTPLAWALPYLQPPGAR